MTISNRINPLTIEVTWKDFRDRMLTYAQLPDDRKQDLLFRGQGNADWSITSTLDREYQFPDNTSRSCLIKRLLEEFREELIPLAQGEQIIQEEALELLGRHYGLPSPLIDWTKSPWIAAYFAFQDSPANTSHVAVWCLDRAKIEWNGEEIDIILDKNLIRFNRRALMQRSVFLRINNNGYSIETSLPQAITLYKIQRANHDKLLALADLDQMGINAARLFADAEGAAKTARIRCSMSMGDTIR